MKAPPPPTTKTDLDDQGKDSVGSLSGVAGKKEEGKNNPYDATTLDREPAVIPRPPGVTAPNKEEPAGKSTALKQKQQRASKEKNRDEVGLELHKHMVEGGNDKPPKKNKAADANADSVEGIVAFIPVRV